MSVYIEEAVVAIEALQEFCERLLQKFDNGTPATELLIETDELVSRIKNLATLLPEDVSLGDWGRKAYFMNVYLKKNEPAGCRGDLAWFAENDLPEAARQVRKWGGTLSYFDEELRRSVAHLVRVRDFSSAVRAAFVVLTDRLRKKFDLPFGVDGSALVNEVFGSKSSLTPHLDDKERQAIRDYLAGAYGVLRNKYAHSNPQLDLAEMEAALATVNLALKLIG
jgi:hypothetical protein